MTPTRIPGLPRRRVLALATVAALAGGAVLAESGAVLKDTPLRSEPLASASEVGQLKARETVQITARQGAWAGVTTPAGTEGWARILNLRTGSAAAAAASGVQLTSVFATGSSGNSVSTGVKGLSAEQLIGASPDASQVATLDGFAVSTGDATAFAAQAPLSAQRVDYLAQERGSRRRNR
ncbi:MAG: SH3 domain-containing protein [Arenimonas sp.]|uniref:SH3 domain-containing protein n=1 Tax=Arenimonas sp. TaxID=1872635 RepID=UPI0025BD3B60|nr:SH3 domain-containing protein [Arenimonas sp.]MBW8367382.1 SH3 domain-containing protein [Arenimonas sp.]